MALGEPCDEAFLHRLATQAPQFIDGNARRVHELLDRAGWYGEGASPLLAQQLVLDGLLTLTGGDSAG